jgi:hypothetical protein
MGGHDGAVRLSSRTAGRLEGNIVILGDHPDQVVLISLDTLFAGATLTRHIVKICADRFAVSEARVLVLASHTHFAPMLDESKPRLGAACPAEVERWCRAMGTALDRMTDHDAACVHAGVSVSDLSVNRRLRWRLPSLVRILGKLSGDVYLCDNPAGPRDPRIRTWIWMSEREKPVAALWSFACHPVGFPEADTASPDYIGVVRDALRDHFGHDLAVIFAPGCMGDVRPRSPVRWNTWRRAGGIAIYGPSAPGFDRASWREWSSALAAEVSSVASQGQSHVVDDDKPRAAPTAVLPMKSLLEGRSPVAELRGKAVFAPGIGRIVALSCEPVTEVAGLISDDSDDLVLGYEGDVFGYLPTDAIRAEGGYEAERFMQSFGMTGRFKPGLDEQIAAMGRSLRP